MTLSHLGAKCVCVWERETDRKKRGAENLEQEAGPHMSCSSNCYGRGSLGNLSGCLIPTWNQVGNSIGAW